MAGKRALVTGGASGIGRAIVEKYLAEGAAVAVAEIRQEARKEIESLGAAFIACDVGSPDDIAGACRQTIEMFSDPVESGVPAVLNAPHEPAQLLQILPRLELPRAAKFVRIPGLS